MNTFNINRTNTVQLFFFVLSLKYVQTMATINFLYRSTKEKANLNIRLLYRNQETDFVFGAKTKLEVSKEYWSKQHGLKRTKDIEIANKQVEVNSELNKIENHILKAFNNTNPQHINKDWLQTQIDHYYNPKLGREEESIPKDLTSYIDYYINYRRHELKESIIKKYNVTKHKLERFEKQRKHTIQISEVNEKFKNEFVNYAVAEKYANNTTERDLGYIKSFCKHARFLGLETHPQLDGLKLSKEKTDIIYLTLDELDKIENIEKEKLSENLENARDWLIISCFMGQRISDFMMFNDSQIRLEANQKNLEFTQTKTGKLMNIPIHPRVIKILDKKNGKFPHAISHQKYNDYIKDVCEIAKITEMVYGSKKTETKPKSKIYRKESGTFRKCDLVTSHIGRRSYASNFYGQIPTPYLIYVTGHSSEKMFLNYIGKSNNDLAKVIHGYYQL